MPLECPDMLCDFTNTFISTSRTQTLSLVGLVATLKIPFYTLSLQYYGQGKKVCLATSVEFPDIPWAKLSHPPMPLECPDMLCDFTNTFIYVTQTNACSRVSSQPQKQRFSHCHYDAVVWQGSSFPQLKFKHHGKPQQTDLTSCPLHAAFKGLKSSIFFTYFRRTFLECISWVQSLRSVTILVSGAPSFEVVKRFLDDMCVDKTRNTEHSGTSRNIPEHSGTFRNIPENEKLQQVL